MKGGADKVVGKDKEVAGHINGDKKLETEGKVDQAKGATRNKVGNARTPADKRLIALGPLQ